MYTCRNYLGTHENAMFQNLSVVFDQIVLRPFGQCLETLI